MSDKKDSIAALNKLIDEGSAKRLKTLLAMVPVDGEDGLGVANARLDGDHLILGLSDDTEIDVGQVVMPQLPPIEGDPGVGIRNVAVVDDELLFTLSNGESHNLGSPWRHGDDGRGVASVALEDGNLVIGFTDGQSDVIGQVEGTDGADGLGIDPDATRIQDGDLVIGFDDATEKNVGRVAGDAPEHEVRSKPPGIRFRQPGGRWGAWVKLPVVAPAFEAGHRIDKGGGGGGGGSGDASSVPQVIKDGETFTVKADTQALYALPISLQAGGVIDIEAGAALVGVD